MNHIYGYENVWFNSNEILNTLSLESFSKSSKVTFDSERGNGFIIHLQKGKTRILKQTERGLSSQITSRRQNQPNISLTFAKVEEKKDQFTKQEVRKDYRTLHLQTTLLFHSYRHVK